MCDVLPPIIQQNGKAVAGRYITDRPESLLEIANFGRFAKKFSGFSWRYACEKAPGVWLNRPVLSLAASMLSFRSVRTQADGASDFLIRKDFGGGLHNIGVR